MDTSLVRVLAFLLAGIAVIVLLTAKFRVHAFFALLISCFVVGIGVGMPVIEIIDTVKSGFGKILSSLGLIIVLGTALGVILESTGSTQVMAHSILKLTGRKHSKIAMSITGLVVGLPIFCDSGYIVLSGLNRSLAKQTATPVAIMACSLATGLYSVHCLIPPHPGAAAAAGLLQVHFGSLMLAGIAVAIPASAAGYWWAIKAGRNSPMIDREETVEQINTRRPPPLASFLPVVVPILLIALGSLGGTGRETGTGTGIGTGTGTGTGIGTGIAVGETLSLLSNPIIALSAGVLLALLNYRGWQRQLLSSLLQDAAEKAGGILVIIGAGGAFGAVLAATDIGDHLAASLPLSSFGILFPFLLTSLLKTAQGSSTVAIITASSIVAPLLPALGLHTGNGPMWCVLAMGAGSMMISHANDAYFWVIAKFAGLDTKTMLRTYTIATIWMGLVSMTVIYLLHRITA